MKTSHVCNELHFSNWQELDARLVWAYRGPPLRMGGRFDNRQLSAWLLLNGSLSVESEPRREIQAGHWVFTPRANRSRVFSADAEIISIKFALRWPDGRELFDLPEMQVLPSGAAPGLERKARPLVRRVERLNLPTGNLLQYQSLALESYLQIDQSFRAWLMEYAEAMRSLEQPPVLARHSDERLLRARAILDAHPLDERLDLHAVAQQVGLSFGHADALFSASFGQTMRAYFDQRRHQAAIHSLRETAKPIKAIAFELGFQAPTSFAHWFRKKERCAPRDFRKR